jgi:hypothetical protein
MISRMRFSMAAKSSSVKGSSRSALEQLLHGAGHDVGAVVADQFQCGGLVLTGHDGQIGILLDRP